jgi:hypothetical protein
MQLNLCVWKRRRFIYTRFRYAPCFRRKVVHLQNFCSFYESVREKFEGRWKIILSALKKEPWMSRSEPGRGPEGRSNFCFWICFTFETSVLIKYCTCSDFCSPPIPQLGRGVFLGRISILVSPTDIISSVCLSDGAQPRELPSLQLSTCSWFLDLQNLHISWMTTLTQN